MKLRARILAAVIVVAVVAWVVLRSGEPGDAESHGEVATSTAVELRSASQSTSHEPPETRSVVPTQHAATRESPDFAGYRKALAEALVQRGDAASLVVAALLQDSAELAMRASQLAPDDATVQWLALAVCRSIAAKPQVCDVAAFEAALRAADPDNALHMLSELTVAQKDGDKNAEAAALAEIANKPRFDLYNATAEPMIYETILAVRVPAPSAPAGGLTPAEVVSSGIVAQLSLPAMRPLIDSCKSTREGLVPDRCRQIGKVMEGSDSYIVRSVGLTIQEQLAPFGSGRHSEIIDRRRTLDWLAYQVAQNPIGPAAAARLMPDTEGEIELWQSWLRENGIPLEPPFDWSRP